MPVAPIGGNPAVASTKTGQVTSVAPKLSSTGNSALDQFVMALASKLGITAVPIINNMMKASEAWQRAEGSQAAFNPFDTTYNMPGDTAYNYNNNDPVKNYQNLQQGVNATYDTLMDSRYANVVNDLRTGNLSTFAQALGSSGWGTKGSTVAEILAENGGPISNWSGSGGSPQGNGQPLSMSSITGDPLYMDQMAALQKQLSDYMGSEQESKANELAKYANETNALNQNKTLDQNKVLDSFGARGIAHSTFYGDAMTNLANQMNTKQDTYNNANQQFLANLAQQQRQFEDTQTNAQQSALAAAAARAAAGLTLTTTGVKTPVTAQKSAIGAANPDVKTPSSQVRIG